MKKSIHKILSLVLVLVLVVGMLSMSAFGEEVERVCSHIYTRAFDRYVYTNAGAIGHYRYPRYYMTCGACGYVKYELGPTDGIFGHVTYGGTHCVDCGAAVSK